MIERSREGRKREREREIKEGRESFTIERLICFSPFLSSLPLSTSLSLSLSHNYHTLPLSIYMYLEREREREREREKGRGRENAGDPCMIIMLKRDSQGRVQCS